ncbi:MAG: DNA-binding protein [Firmicutes bacterium]|nr:DNA-binding protein [Bacillota bacterium]
MKEYALGIDTSNYKTSVAVVDREDNIVYDGRIFLSVPEGQIGIRQQEALFQHIGNLPELLKEAFDATRDGKIISVSASNRPRPIEGSYMPCFLAGEKEGQVIASLLSCEFNCLSHQEGHLESARRFTKLCENDDFIFFHFSGGTTEILRYGCGRIAVLGESEDISFGQLLDRTGNKFGISFPAGEVLDALASSFVPSDDYENRLPKIKVGGLKFNLSGIETAAGKYVGKMPADELSYMLFERILECIKNIVINACDESGLKNVLFAGGVSSSSFIRKGMEGFEKYSIYFSKPELSSDNAIGIAFIGGDKFWRENR